MAGHAVTPPIWLLDVDGVLNVMHLGLPLGHRSFVSGNGFQITYREDLVKRLADLHVSGRVEIRWLTTWEHLADVHLAEEMGLPRGLELGGRSPFRNKGGWWKLEAVRRLYAEGHRLIWTDDDIRRDPEAEEWLETTDPARILWHSPDDRVGLTDEFMERVDAWLEES